MNMMKRLKLPVIRSMFRDVMYSMMTTVNNTVLGILKLLRDEILNVFHHVEKFITILGMDVR